MRAYQVKEHLNTSEHRKAAVGKKLSLKMNSLWNVSGIVLYTLSQWGILVVIAKFSTAEMVGIFTLGLALTAPVMMLMRFNLRVAVASDDQNQYSFSEYFTSRVYTTVGFILIMGIVSIAYSDQFYTMTVILLLSLARAVDSISDILHGRLQKEERMDLVAKSLILKGILSLGLFSLLMIVIHDLFISIIGMLVGWLVILVVYDYRKTRNFTHIQWKWKRKDQKAIFFLTLPLGLALLVDSLVANIPRYFIESFQGVEALGFYAAIFYIIHAGSNVVIAISNAVLPRMSKDFQAFRLKKFIQLNTVLVLLLSLGGLLAVGFVYYYGGDVLSLLYTSEYEGYNHLFFLLMVAGVIKYLGKFIETALFATRKFKVQPYINGVTMLIIAVLSFLWIPSYGLNGAAYALLVAELIQLIVRGLILALFLYQQHSISKQRGEHA
ncbi:oligosaccharide flippase family protein [Halobacillus yeomjeoni]|uniref:lipopolysaccharide biosynthesis protein n=1 Tax=Halobacillus yeomjeoni TaxID=311194 RepID=UPI001CD33B6B|nr:oligosaccharide flippase family protein [Halobacillus yeomjeoni]MCA0985135.1 oligosaccharide flippase family protein [Halobacillus yeomjeoni]